MSTEIETNLLDKCSCNNRLSWKYREFDRTPDCDYCIRRAKEEEDKYSKKAEEKLEKFIEETKETPFEKIPLKYMKEIALVSNDRKHIIKMKHSSRLYIPNSILKIECINRRYYCCKNLADKFKESEASDFYMVYY